MCEFHLRSWEMCTPRYLIWGTEERVWPWRMYLCRKFTEFLKELLLFLYLFFFLFFFVAHRSPEPKAQDGLL